jgi:hypothetical protein
MPEYKPCDFQPVRPLFPTRLFVPSTHSVRFRYSSPEQPFFRKKLFAMPLYLWYNCSCVLFEQNILLYKQFYAAEECLYTGH